jgi:hypothetical protein
MALICQLQRLTSIPDTLRHMRRRSRSRVSAGKTSNLIIGTGFALHQPRSEQLPPVFAFELAAMRIQALAAFFSPAPPDARAKPLICKEMLENKAFHAQGGRSRG